MQPWRIARYVTAENIPSTPFLPSHRTPVLLLSPALGGGHNKQDGGVMWTRGTITILGAQLRDNSAEDVGDAILSGDNNTTIVPGGVFEGNKAYNGGAVFVESDAELAVADGVFFGNEAENSGGALFIGKRGSIKVREGGSRHFGR